MFKVIFFQSILFLIVAEKVQSDPPCDFKNGSFDRICYGNQTIFPNSPYSRSLEFVKYRICKRTANYSIADYVVFSRRDLPDTISYVIGKGSDKLYIETHNNPSETQKKDTLKLYFNKSDTIYIKTKPWVIDTYYSQEDHRWHYWNADLGIIKVKADTADCFQSYSFSVADKKVNKIINSLLKNIK